MGKDEQQRPYRRESNFASGLFWGAALGAVGMFLFGTKKGNKLRKYMQEHGGKVLEELEELYDARGDLGAGGKEDVKVRGEKKTEQKPTKKPQELNHIRSIQERGRKAAKRFFRRKGKSLRT